MGGFILDSDILNQKATPAFFADVFANRPAAGYTGRMFISTDTFEFFRDTGSGYQLIGGPGSGTITGAGTAGTLPVFSGAGVIADSVLTQAGGNLSTTGTFTASSFIKSGGLATEALMANGSVTAIAAINTASAIVQRDASGDFAASNITLSGTLSSTAVTASGNVTGGAIVKSGGTASQFLKADGSVDATAYGTGSVTTVSVTTANGVSGSVATATTTPAITITLGAITPSSVVATGNITATTNLEVTAASTQPFLRISRTVTGVHSYYWGINGGGTLFLQDDTGGVTRMTLTGAGALNFNATTNVTGDFYASTLGIGAIDNVKSSTYTPTITNILNVGASGPVAISWIRVGNTVNVTGIIPISPTATGLTQFRMSLPVASNLGNYFELAGVAMTSSQPGITVGSQVTGDTANDQAKVEVDLATSAPCNITVSFNYQVI
jgi:hypothetical protein